MKRPEIIEAIRETLKRVAPNCEIVLFTNIIACNYEHPTCDYAMP